MRKWMVLCIAVMTLILSACGEKGAKAPSPLDYLDTVKSIDLAAETGGLRAFGTSEKEVIEKRGEPKLKGTLKGSTSWKGEVILGYDDMTYNLNGGKVQGFSLEAAGKTAREVKIGDDKARIEAQYGKDFYMREVENVQVIGYLDKENNIAIEFILENDRSMAILISDFAMYES